MRTHVCITIEWFVDEWRTPLGGKMGVHAHIYISIRAYTHLYIHNIHTYTSARILRMARSVQRVTSKYCVIHGSDNMLIHHAHK